jgi:hypothetical protein
MTEFQDIHCFDCPCGEAIPLPPQNPLGIYEGLGCRPTGRWPISWWCRNYGQLHPGLEPKFELFRPKPGSAQNLRLEALWQIDCECAHSNCGAHHTIYTKWFARGLEEELKNTVAGAFVGFWCGEGDERHSFYPKLETMRAEKFEF